MDLDTLLEIVTPLNFAQVYAEQNSIVTRGEDICCTFRGVGEFRIHAGGFVSTNLAYSVARAGSIIDIKAMMNTSTSSWSVVYREAVSSIIKKFKNLLPVGCTDNHVIDKIADDALKQRRVFNACVCKSRPLTDLPGGLALRANNSLSGLYAVGGISFLNSYDLEQLENKLNKSGVNCKLPKTSVLLVPYFSKAYKIACIELIYGKRNSQNSVIWLDNSEIAIAGLLGLKESSKCFLETNLNDVLVDIKKSTEDYADFFTIKINPDGDGCGWLPKTFFYVDRTDSPLDLWLPANLVKYGSLCVITKYPSITDSAIMGNSMPWGDAIVDSVTKLLEECDTFTPQVKFLLSTVKSDKKIKLRIKERLEKLGKFVLSDQLDIEFRDGAIWQDPQGCLYSTANGYLWEDSANKRFGGVLVTNFTVQPEYSVRYDTGELYKAMEVTVGNETRHILLNPSSFDTVKKFSEKTEEAISLSGNPTVISPSTFDFIRSRPVLTWLMKKYTELPIKIGTSYIGWNPTRTKFIGTGYVVQNGEVTTADCMYRPGIDYLRYFSSSSNALVKSNTLIGIPFDLTKLIYQCAAIMMRSYSGHVLTPVEYSGDKCTRETLQRIFSYAGQLGTLQLNKNMRAMGEMDCIQGYPFLAQGYNRSQAKACKVGMILVGEEGIQLDAFTPEAEQQAGQYLRYIFEVLPKYLIKNCGPSFMPTVGIIPVKVLEEEGKKIIDEMEL